MSILRFTMLSLKSLSNQLYELETNVSEFRNGLFSIDKIKVSRFLGYCCGSGIELTLTAVSS